MSSFCFEKECFPSSPFFFQQTILTSQEILSSWGIIPLFYLLSVQCFFPLTFNPCFSFASLYQFLRGRSLMLCILARDKALYLFLVFQESSGYCKICKWFSESWNGNFLVNEKLCYYFSLEVILYVYASVLCWDSNMCLRPMLIGNKSVNARADFVHWELLFHCFFLVCVNKCVHTTQKTHSSKLIFDPNFNFEKSKSNVQ